MRLTTTVIDRAAGPPAEPVTVQLDAAPTSRVADLAVATGRLLRGGGTGPLPRLFAGPVPLDPRAELRETGLRDGTPLGVDGPVPGPPVEPAGTVEVRYSGGVGAGPVIRLGPGEFTVGTHPRCRVRLAEPGPPIAAHLRVSVDRAVVIRPAVAGLRLDGATLPVGTDTNWPAESPLGIGPMLLELAHPTPRDAAVGAAEGSGQLTFSRPPRLVPPAEPARLRLPSPPPAPERRRLPLLTVLLLPLVLAVAGAIAFGNARFLLFGLLSPVGALVTQLAAGRRGRQGHREKVAEHAERVSRLEGEIAAAVVTEERWRRASSPDPAAAALLAVGPRQRLWERRFTDSDFLTLRAGTAELPSSVEVEDPSQDEHRRRAPRPARDVPVTVALRDVGVLGVCGDGSAPRLGAWLVLQAALLHSPADLRICVLSLTGEDGRWSWARWLPHATVRDEDALRFIGTTPESIGRRVAELNALVAARRQAGGRTPRGGAHDEPDVLVVLDGAHRLRMLPGVPALLREGPTAGVHAVCLEVEERLLPEECGAVAVCGPDGLRVQPTDAVPVVGARPDAPTFAWCDDVARLLAPLRILREREDDAALPASVRLLDLLDLEPVDPGRIAAGWAVGGRSTTALIGAGLDGRFQLDLVADGPHGLIAGTTGAGKSELLQTLVASLAVANRPDELTFVLVDYKGGSAFAECRALPHTVGMVTDLDAHLVQRALVSLGAELRRREHVLADAGAKDIDDYQLRRRRDPGLPTLPRLVLVIDEFASMVRDLPDFVTGLVNIAQRGRSLGIHLILATQRPAGAITPDIQANTNLRIALRTTDGNESRDIIGVPDAGNLPPRIPGRAYARVGQSAVLPFQAARIGGRRPGATRPAPTLPELTELRWASIGDPVPPTPGGSDETDVEETDLGALCRAVRAAAADLRIPAPRAPWLPPLPDLLPLSKVPGAGTDPPATGTPTPPDGDRAVIGLIDRPAEQSRDPLTVDLATAGHLHIVGSPRSGRSQALRTVAAALTRLHSCADLHLYGVDCGNGALHPLAELPHTGAVVDRRQPERLGRLFDRLTAEVASRQALIGGRGVADLTELRTLTQPEERPPHIVLMIDRFEVFEREFADYDRGSLLDKLTRVLRDGAGAGVHMILAGDRVLGSYRYAGTTEDRIVLRLNDRADYATFGIGKAAVPDQLPPGRGLLATDGSEVQIAVLGDDPSGAAQSEALAQHAATVITRDAHIPARRRPRPIDPLPDRIGFDEAWAARPDGAGPLWAMIGVGGDELAASGPDLAGVPTFAVGGPPRSGRSTALAAIARSLTRAGTAVVIVAPRPSPLRELAGLPGVRALITDPDVPRTDFRAALGGIDTPTAVVVIDDAELLLHSEIEPDLVALARGAAGPGWALVVGGNADALSTALSGWIAQVRRNRAGALLAPQSSTESELVGARIPAGMIGGQGPQGRAYLHLGTGRFRTVQVPEAINETGTGDGRPAR
jgi:S-DNA-T family DNA segregation ATPase FtsK/SpoIIIE